MIRKTSYAAVASMLIWAAAVLAMGSMSDREPNAATYYVPSGSWTVYQDVTGQYTMAMRGAVSIGK